MFVVGRVFVEFRAAFVAKNNIKYFYYFQTQNQWSKQEIFEK